MFLTNTLKSMQAGVEMIRMPHVHSNISMPGKLGFINSLFYRFLKFCSCKEFFVLQMVSLIVLLKVKELPFKGSSKEK